jgi:O-antigen/teichoic acid export membrane protein
MSETRRPPSLFGAAAATYGTNLAVSLLSLVNVLVVARALGPSGRGAVAFLVAVAILSAQASSLGVEEANANIGGAEQRLRPALATNSLLLAFVLGAGAAALVAVVVTVVPAAGAGIDRDLLRVALVSIPIVLAKQYLNLLVQADYRFRHTNLAWIIGPATGVADS